MTDYNGWTNYQTWVINLWLNNDSGTCDYILELADEALETEYPKATLMDSIKEYIEEYNPITEASLYSDLMQSAIDSANYYEIAEHWLESAKEINDCANRMNGM